MLTKDETRWFKRFRAMGVGGIVGEEARTCLQYARAMVWLDAHADEDVEGAQYRQLTGITWIEDNDADLSLDHPETIKAIEEGRYLVLGCVLRVSGEVEASLWSVIVESTRDDYCRIVEAQLVCEYLDRIGWQLELPLEAA